MRLYRLFAVCTVAAGSVVGLGASPANAGELCEQVQVIAPVPPSGPGFDFSYCQPYNGTLCQGQGAEVDPKLLVYVTVCAPDPFAAP